MAEQTHEIGEAQLTISGVGKLNEYWYGHVETSVPTTETDITITPDKGTSWFVKRIEVYCAGAGAGMYYQLLRGGNAVTGRIYYGPSYGNITFNKVNAPTSDSIVIRVYTASASTEDVYINLQLYYQ